MPISGIKSITCVLVFAILSLTAWSDEQIGSEQPLIEPNTSFEIGGPDRVELWQTFEIGELGDPTSFPPLLTAIELAIFCPSAVPLMEIYNGSWLNPVRRSYVERNRGAIRDPRPNLERFELTTPIEHRVIESYAIRIRLVDSPPNETCTISGGTFDNSDPQVTLYISDANQEIFDDFRDYFDRRDIEMAYRALVDVPSDPPPSEFCDVAYSGSAIGGPPELPEEIPLCRCFEDPLLFELRCGYMSSDFFLLSRHPWPLELGQSYKETWEFRPFKALAAPVKLRLEGGDLSKPIEKDFKSQTSKSLIEKFEVKRVYGGPDADKLGTSSLTFRRDDLSEQTFNLSPPINLEALRQKVSDDLKAPRTNLQREKRKD
ncbi:MAG: hypothetical protein AAF683_01620 [Pseudomonadota bacterium]